jgi:GrpB-like predicted nucleotidyltransferase (UPF0157 family)
MFERLPREVECGKRLTRLVGFEGQGQPSDRLRFFGIEVDSIETVPAGLMAWELDETTWRAYQPRGGRNRVAWKEGITWRWLNKAANGRGPCAGEFVARGAPGWWGGVSPRQAVFRMIANVPFDLERPAFEDDILLVDYDDSWPGQFSLLSAWLQQTLGADIALRIEHYGSTAIPRMPAKPVIDVLVEVPSVEQGKKRALSAFVDDTWEYWWYANHVVFFKRKHLMGERLWHVHMAPKGHEIWKGLIFRDYLRSNPEDAVRYANMKRGLAQAYRDDRERYTTMKTDFVSEILRKASG